MRRFRSLYMAYSTLSVSRLFVHLEYCGHCPSFNLISSRCERSYMQNVIAASSNLMRPEGNLLLTKPLYSHPQCSRASMVFLMYAFVSLLPFPWNEPTRPDRSTHTCGGAGSLKIKQTKRSCQLRVADAGMQDHHAPALSCLEPKFDAARQHAVGL
jgi:hypothetical protein